MKLTTHSAVPVYTVSGSSTARPLPEWLARKRKRSLKQDPEFANRIELLQDFEFEEASSCVRVSEDGNWVMSTGTYKPQIHTHYLPHLSLSYARHTNTVNQTFLLLSSDYSKSLHLQCDRQLEFHTPGGLHYATRIPRYGRDLVFSKHAAEALIPAVGVNGDGNGEVFRLNLEVGRFMRGYEVDVGGDDMTSLGGGALQGGINTGAVNTAAVAEESHNLLAFGTSLGTVEFWDSRSRSRVGVLPPAHGSYMTNGDGSDGTPEISALEFHRSGLTLATGTSNGLIYTYDLRSPVPLLKKDQGYGYPIQTLTYLSPSTSSRSAPISEEKILSSDKRIIKIWDAGSGDPWTSVEPAVDINHVEWCKDSGMLLTANEGRQMHSFFIPQLGPAPKWCSFLDNLVEEMAEDAADPSSYNSAFGAGNTGEVYDNYKFLDMKSLRELNLDHLIGTTSALRPYMHGHFVAQRLYEEARLISNPELFEQQRAKSIQEKIEKERESRIRGNKAVKVKVNKRLAEKMLKREEDNERRKARRLLAKAGDGEADSGATNGTAAAAAAAATDIDERDESGEDAEPVGRGALADPRFSRLFQDEDFEIDETSREFASINPSTARAATDASDSARKRGLTAVEEEALADRRGGSSSDESESDEDDEETRPSPRKTQKPTEKEKDNGRVSSTNYKKSGHRPQSQRSNPHMLVSTSAATGRKPQQSRNDRSFGARMASSRPSDHRNSNGAGAGRRAGGVVGEKEVTFAPTRVQKQRPTREARAQESAVQGRREARGKDRRSASGNVFRRM